MTRYTRDEDAYLKANWRTTDDRDMAFHLGRPVNSIACRRYALGLKRESTKPSMAQRPACYASPIVRPDPPRGIQPEAVIWARMNPTHPEARLILGGYAERDLYRPSREGERA